ncbi:MAG: hypothetical protein ABW215_22925, partial [Kibdelosporangium sp.]
MLLGSPRLLDPGLFDPGLFDPGLFDPGLFGPARLRLGWLGRGLPAGWSCGGPSGRLRRLNGFGRTRRPLRGALLRLLCRRRYRRRLRNRQVGAG